MDLPVVIRVFFRKPGDGRRRFLGVLVDAHSGAVGERDSVLDGRENDLESVLRQLKVDVVRRQLHAHEEVGVQVVIKPGQDGFLGQESAAEAVIPFNDEDLLPSPRQVAPAD